MILFGTIPLYPIFFGHSRTFLVLFHGLNVYRIFVCTPQYYASRRIPKISLNSHANALGLFMTTIFIVCTLLLGYRLLFYGT